MFCPFCGKSLAEDAKFCSGCGKKVINLLSQESDYSQQSVLASETPMKGQFEPKKRNVKRNVILSVVFLVIVSFVVYGIAVNIQAKNKVIQRELRRNSESFLSDFVEKYVLKTTDSYITARKFHKANSYEVFMACGVDSSKCDHAVWYVSDAMPDEILFLKLHDKEDAEEIKEAYTRYAESKDLSGFSVEIKVFDEQSDKFLALFLASVPESTTVEGAFQNEATLRNYQNSITHNWIYYLSF